MSLASRLRRLERERAKRDTEGCAVCGGLGILVMEIEGAASAGDAPKRGCPACGAAYRVEIVEYRGAGRSAA